MLALKKVTGLGLIALIGAFLAGVVVSSLVFIRPAKADLDPKALVYTLPDKIQWTKQGDGAENAVLVGDPSKP